MKFTTEKDIETYIKYYPNFDPTNTEHLIQFGNYIAGSAISLLNNHLYEHIWEGNCNLTYGIAKGCRCGSCWEWQLEDIDTNEVIDSTETLTDWVGKLKRKDDEKKT